MNSLPRRVSPRLRHLFKRILWGGLVGLGRLLQVDSPSEVLNGDLFL